VGNQLHESHQVRKGDVGITELYFRNSKCTRDIKNQSTVEIQIVERARKFRDEALTNLRQFINEELLEEKAKRKVQAE